MKEQLLQMAIIGLGLIEFGAILLCFAYVIGYMAGEFSCKHHWILLKEGEVVRTNGISGNKGTIGFFKLYECPKCKKLRKEQETIE